MVRPQASIIVPLRRQRSDWLRQCVTSGLNQTANVEVIVVCAEDTPRENRALLEQLSAAFEHLRVFTRPAGCGFAGAINAGVAAARADRVGMLLSDDWLHEHTLATCLGVEADLVSTGMEGFSADGTESLWCKDQSNAVYNTLTGIEEQADYLGHFLLIRKALFEAVGGVDPEVGLTGADDYDLPWTLLEAGATVSIVEERLYCARDHGEERLTLRDPAQQLRDLRRVLTKHGVSPERIEVLVDNKRRWYGAPTHVALHDPRWFLSTDPGGSD